MTVADARSLLTPTVRATLAKCRRGAYAPDYLQSAGVPAPLVSAMLVPATAPAEAARLKVGGRKHAMTNRYVFGPDIAGYLKGWE